MLRKLSLLGPAFIVGATQFGPGNITTSSSVGADVGYTLIWLLVISMIFMLVYTDMSVRIGMASKEEGAIQAIKYRLGSAVGVLVGIGVSLVAFLFNIGSILGAALGLQLLFSGDIRLWVGVSTLIALGLLLTRNYYASLEKLMLGLIGLMIVVFAITAFVTDPNWEGVGAGLIPSFPAENVTLFIALLGTNFSVNSAFFASYTIREKGTGSEQYRETTLTDTLAGVIAPAIMTILIVIAATNVLLPRGGTVDSAATMARILDPTVGRWAFIVFGIGIFAAGFTSVMGNATGGSFMFSGAFNWGSHLYYKKTRAVVAGLVLVPAVVAVVFGEFPIQAIITAQALTILVVPLTGAVMLLLANNRRHMGSLANSTWQNVLGVLGWLVLVAGVIVLIRDLFF